MRSLGETLRRARLQQGLSLDDAASGTRIRRQYLEALEAEDASSLPAAVYARGLLKAYAEYLGLNSQAVADLYQPAPRREAAGPPLKPAVPHVTVPREIPIRPLIYLASVVAAIAVVVWGWTQLQAAAAAIRDQQGLTAIRSATPTLKPGVPTPVPIAAASPNPTATPTPEPSPSPTPGIEGILVEFRTSQRVWVEASVDGKQVVSEMLQGGAQRTLPLARDAVIMRVSNGSAMQVTVNGKPQDAPTTQAPVEFQWRK